MIANRKIYFKDRDKVIALVDSFHDDDVWLTGYNKNKLYFDVYKYKEPHKKIIFTFSKNAVDSFNICVFIAQKAKLKGRVIESKKRKTFINEKLMISECYINKDEFDFFCRPYNSRRFRTRDEVIFNFTNLESIEITDIDDSEIVEKLKDSK